MPGHQHDRAPPGGALDLSGDPRDSVGIQAAGRLVQDEQIGVGDQGLGDQCPLRVPAGQRLEPDLRGVRQAEPAHGLAGAAL